MTSATDELRKSLDFMRIWISEDAHLGESEFSRDLEKAEGLRKLDAIEQAIAATLRSERESELRDALNDVAEKWAIAQVQAADSARRCRLLEALVRDWQELYENPDYGECVRLTDRTRKLGIEVEQ